MDFFSSKYKYIFFVSCLLVSFLYGDNNHINCIDKNDREKLEIFFQYIVRRSSIGYCLCGKKPIATETFIKLKNIPKKHIHQMPKIVFEHFGYSILWNGWKCWERYAHLFPSKDFVLRFIDKFDTLVLINKPACKRAIEENIDLFHKYLKIQDSAQEVLDKICYPKDNEDYIFKHTALLGILYGYGRNNSIAFANCSYIQKLKLHTRSELINPIFGYGLAIINNGTNKEENKLVINEFEMTRKFIKQTFSSNNNLENFLELYMGKEETLKQKL